MVAGKQGGVLQLFTGVGAELTIMHAHLKHDLRAVLTTEQTKKLKQIESDVAGANIDSMLFRMASMPKRK